MIRLTRAQVREIDRLSIEQYHIPGIVLMENASRAVADHIVAMYGVPKSAIILCGGGNNGGDGLAVARHLHNRGTTVHLVLNFDPANYKGDAMINWQIIQAMHLPVITLATAQLHLENRGGDIIVDALFGTGLTAAPRSPFEKFVKWVDGVKVPVISIDLPSGLDCDTGDPLGPCIRATRTVTFVTEKAGFANPASKLFTGEVTVADIGCPTELIQIVSAS